MFSGVKLSIRSFNSFDKNIPDADNKIIIQQHFKLKKYAWRIYELRVENVRKKRHSTS